MKTYTFIDLFCGIGGLRIPFEELGAKCIFSSDYDKHSQITYRENFGEEPRGDIRAISNKNIPRHNILLAGFPCQPFSISGVSKKKSLNKPHGFMDKAQGTLFFEIARILKAKKPDCFVLENVKNLKSHDKGNTYRVIKDTLEEIGYHIVFDDIIDAGRFVPQHRERVFIIGFKKPIKFGPLNLKGETQRFKDILEKKVDDKYTLTDNLWAYLQSYAEKHRAKGNGFGYGLVDLHGVSRTLSARYYKDGSEILIPQKGKNPRRLTPVECSKLMGFPENYKIVVSDTQAYRQFGNAVTVPVVRIIAKEVIKCLNESARK
ncbi:MAG: DNA (cytosine-5-)-methyltransferase [Candidatus Omnitrophica bacterium]|nr:DNA (cytosine-5-)-methyltransferase [Candidatus Omnitrophota bacterium]